jgi:mannose-6-phosphate isomerase-like protein (cupin superfamily)
MSLVTHIFDALPESENTIEVQRKENLLLFTPPPTAMKLWSMPEPLRAVNFAQEFIPTKFAPPIDIFAGKAMRLEWQQMNNRQPFYHRNMDVDELSYQVSGERCLMTELGTVELRAGDFSRIPVGIAHDNFGRKEVHLLFYVHGPSIETGIVTAEGEKKEVPFKGFVLNGTHTEMITECMGERGCDLAVCNVDEQLILSGEVKADEKLLVQRSSGTQTGTEWLYKSPKVWIGCEKLQNALGVSYTTHRKAVAVHYQIGGRRTLVSQHGTIELVPGDFVSIPVGCGYTSISAGESTHLVVLCKGDLKLLARATKTAKPTTIELVNERRAQFSGKPN